RPSQSSLPQTGSTSRLKRLRCAANLDRRMMTTSVGCGDGWELPYDRIKESGDFRRCHDVRAVSAQWSLLEDKRTSREQPILVAINPKATSAIKSAAQPNPTVFL